MIPLSAFIITKNEENLIATAINSIKNIVNEIIIVDSGSTDNTLVIAQSMGAKVIHNKWEGYVKQKIFAEQLCKNNWVLNIDADEEFSIELQQEIDYMFKAQVYERFKAYIIKFLIMMPNDKKPRFLAPSNSYIRLYNKNYASFSNILSTNSTHDIVHLNNGISKDQVLTLLEPAFHRSTTSIFQVLQKANFYTSQQAQDLIEKNRKVSKIRVIIEFFWWFIKAFLIRRYFVFGFQGVIYSMIFAFNKFIRLAKVYEHHNK